MSQFTKKAIMESFTKLLEQKPLDKITVKDIVEDCDINRGTFYYYYPDIYALVEDIFEGEARRILEAHDIYDSWQEGFLSATQLARESKRKLYHAYNAISREKLEKYLFRIAGHMMHAFVSQQAEGLGAAEEDIEFLARFYTCGLVGLTLRWIEDGMKVDPEAYINKMGTLLEGSIRDSLQKSVSRPGNKAACVSENQTQRAGQ